MIMRYYEYDIPIFDDSHVYFMGNQPRTIGRYESNQLIKIGWYMVILSYIIRDIPTYWMVG